jgi:1,4-alpha-glucan branching enzyme
MKAPQKPSEQVFTITAPGATKVALVGDFTHWQQRPLAMKPTGGGQWQVSVPLAPGTYHYRFLVDGEWRDDPECTLRVPNPFGSQDAVRTVPTA